MSSRSRLTVPSAATFLTDAEDGLAGRRADGNDHDPARSKLPEERGRNVVDPARHDDPVEGRVLLPAVVAVIHFSLDVAVLRVRRLQALVDGVRLGGQASRRSLWCRRGLRSPTAAMTGSPDPVPISRTFCSGQGIEVVGHPGDQVRSRDGLTVPDGQHCVFVRAAGVSGKILPRGPQERLPDALVCEVAQALDHLCPVPLRLQELRLLVGVLDHPVHERIFIVKGWVVRPGGYVERHRGLRAGKEDAAGAGGSGCGLPGGESCPGRCSRGGSGDGARGGLCRRRVRGGTLRVDGNGGWTLSGISRNAARRDVRRVSGGGRLRCPGLPVLPQWGAAGESLGSGQKPQGGPAALPPKAAGPGERRPCASCRARQRTPWMRRAAGPRALCREA